MQEPSEVEGEELDVEALEGDDLTEVEAGDGVLVEQVDVADANEQVVGDE